MTRIQNTLVHSSEISIEEQLYHAVRWHHLQAVQRLLLRLPNPKRKEWILYDPLHEAALRGLIDIVEVLVQNLDVDSVNADGWTALMCAASYGHAEVVQVLIDSDAKVNLQDGKGFSALHFASMYGRVEIISLLVESGAHVDQQNSNGSTALHWAVEMNRRLVVKMLIDAHAEPNIKDRCHKTPIVLAKSMGYQKMVKMLEKQEVSQLSSAARKNNLPKVRRFLRSLRHPSRQQWGFHAPLHEAASYGHTKVVRALIDGGIDVNSVNQTGGTALHYASRHGQVTVVRLLMEHSARIEARDNGDWTPMQLAVEFSHPVVVQALKETGAKKQESTLDLTMNTENEEILEGGPKHNRPSKKKPLRSEVHRLSKFHKIGRYLVARLNRFSSSVVSPGRRTHLERNTLANLRKLGASKPKVLFG